MSLTSFGVMVASVSAMLARCLAEAPGHFISEYARVWAYHVVELSAWTSEVGRPVSVSNCSRLRRAASSSERRPSA